MPRDGRRSGRPARRALSRPASYYLAPLLVVAVFFEHWSATIAGHHFLPEHFVAVLLFGALLVEGRWRRVWAVAMQRTALLLAAYVAWEGIVSVLWAPNPSDSLAIVGWLCFDWLMLVLFVTTFEDVMRLEALTVKSSIVLAAFATAVAILALLTPSTFLLDHGGGVYAVSREANMLASTVAVWAFVGISSASARIRWLSWRVGLPLSAAAIAFSNTRAVMIGLPLGILVWAELGGREDVRRVVRKVAVAVVALAAAVALLPWGGNPVRDGVDNLFTSRTAIARGASMSSAKRSRTWAE